MSSSEEYTPSNLQVNRKYKHPFIFANFFLFISFISLALYLYFNLMEVKEEMVAYHKDQQIFYL
jgi:bacteriorhodopsin